MLILPVSDSFHRIFSDAARSGRAGACVPVQPPRTVRHTDPGKKYYLNFYLLFDWKGGNIRFNTIDRGAETTDAAGAGRQRSLGRAISPNLSEQAWTESWACGEHPQDCPHRYTHVGVLSFRIYADSVFTGRSVTLTGFRVFVFCMCMIGKEHSIPADFFIIAEKSQRY